MIHYLQSIRFLPIRYTNKTSSDKNFTTKEAVYLRTVATLNVLHSLLVVRVALLSNYLY